MSEEKLHETIRGLYGTIKHHKDLGISLIHKNADLQQRIDKAIDILKSISKDVILNDRYNEIAKALSILKGKEMK